MNGVGGECERERWKFLFLKLRDGMLLKDGTDAGMFFQRQARKLFHSHCDGNKNLDILFRPYTFFQFVLFTGGTGNPRESISERGYTGSRAIFISCDFYNYFHGWDGLSQHLCRFHFTHNCFIIYANRKRERERNQGRNTASTCTLCVCL